VSAMVCATTPGALRIAAHAAPVRADSLEDKLKRMGVCEEEW